MVNGTVYLPGATIPITDVGDSYPCGSGANPVDPGPTLCVVDVVIILVVVLWVIGSILMVP